MFVITCDYTVKYTLTVKFLDPTVALFLFTCLHYGMLFNIGVDTSDPGVKAFQQYYITLQNALDSHIDVIASSSYSRGLISGIVTATITCTPYMPTDDKVNKFLSTVEKHIAEDHKFVKVFAQVLIDQGSYLSVIGNDLEKTYREYFLL